MEDFEIHVNPGKGKTDALFGPVTGRMIRVKPGDIPAQSAYIFIPEDARMKALRESFTEPEG